ncbi:hypothetical protein DRE_07388 [Drechslerella stenobrocha 248]|uniref:Tyrosine specific protein phosphatases domain-containing protein n=1 Tax=Drechslerella stenobrocha 248 TaxID=1043628 RepID=W7HV38_9PEZI|nr:hypothetical protein DRE_07388 [Drechslerella stenobrocha 248]
MASPADQSARRYRTVLAPCFPPLFSSYFVIFFALLQPAQSQWTTYINVEANSTITISHCGPSCDLQYTVKQVGWASDPVATFTGYGDYDSFTDSSDALFRYLSRYEPETIIGSVLRDEWDVELTAPCCDQAWYITNGVTVNFPTETGEPSSCTEQDASVFRGDGVGTSQASLPTDLPFLQHNCSVSTTVVTNILTQIAFVHATPNPPTATDAGQSTWWDDDSGTVTIKLDLIPTTPFTISPCPFSSMDGCTRLFATVDAYWDQTTITISGNPSELASLEAEYSSSISQVYDWVNGTSGGWADGTFPVTSTCCEPFVFVNPVTIFYGGLCPTTYLTGFSSILPRSVAYTLLDGFEAKCNYDIGGGIASTKTAVFLAKVTADIDAGPHTTPKAVESTKPETPTTPPQARPTTTPVRVTSTPRTTIRTTTWRTTTRTTTTKTTTEETTTRGTTTRAAPDTPREAITTTARLPVIPEGGPPNAPPSQGPTRQSPSGVPGPGGPGGSSQAATNLPIESPSPADTIGPTGDGAPPQASPTPNTSQSGAPPPTPDASQSGGFSQLSPVANQPEISSQTTSAANQRGGLAPEPSISSILSSSPILITTTDASGDQTVISTFTVATINTPQDVITTDDQGNIMTTRTTPADSIGPAQSSRTTAYTVTTRRGSGFAIETLTSTIVQASSVNTDLETTPGATTETTLPSADESGTSGPNSSLTGAASTTAVHNCRDVGQSINQYFGKNVMKEGQLFRSGRLDYATATDMQVLTKSARLQSILDLRTKHEREHQLTAPSGRRPVAVISSATTYSIPYLNDEYIKKALLTKLSWYRLIQLLVCHLLGWGVAAVTILSTYAIVPMGLKGIATECLRWLGPEIKQTFEILSDESNYPALVHCTQGKDRTGLAVALVLLSFLGDGDGAVHAVDHDYMLSNDGLKRVRAEMLQEMLPLGYTEESGFVDAEEGWVQTVVDELGKKGGILMYLASIGVPADQVERIRQHLLVDA